MPAAEYLTPEDFSEGSEAYIRYCAGLAIVQFPEDMVNIHRLENNESTAGDIITTAERMMIHGIVRVIRIAQEPEYRKHKLTMEDRFQESLWAMRELVDYTCERHEYRLERLNPMYSILRPAPFLKEQIYRKICHGNYTTLRTIRLLDDFVPDLSLLDTIADRTVAAHAHTTDIED
ncbi:hypothetical protein HY003_03645 [Candidatus Saccharibacteria bacterium]|nr:hypothetical protein [Candidatus Saccharibacteria bacterium]MBI3338366.1 hypothetical protein [Candidatus Saccharibacteria bacterium]